MTHFHILKKSVTYKFSHFLFKLCDSKSQNTQCVLSGPNMHQSWICELLSKLIQILLHVNQKWMMPKSLTAVTWHTFITHRGNVRVLSVFYVCFTCWNAQKDKNDWAGKWLKYGLSWAAVRFISALSNLVSMVSRYNSCVKDFILGLSLSLQQTG